MVENLTKEEKTILEGKLGINCEKMTNKELADSLGFEQRQISFIYARAINKLKNSKNAELLKNYYRDI